MKLTAKKKSAPKPSASPYDSGRREWMERYGDLISQARNWRFAAIAAICVAAIAVLGLIGVKNDQRILAYVVETNGDGSVIGVRQLQTGARAEQKHIRAALNDWVTGARVVYVDGKAIRTVIDKTYALTMPGSAAFQELSQYHRANSPYSRAVQETVDVRVESVLPISDDTWRIEWVEVVRARTGRQQTQKRWQATATIDLRTPTEPNALMKNPYGIFVANYSWAERL